MMQRKIDKICEKHGSFVREIWFLPAFDERNPEPKKNYGWHGMDILFVLKKGKTKAVTFRVFSNWHWKDEFYENIFQIKSLVKPMGASIDYHDIKPHYKGQEKYGPCDYLGGKECYTDGSCLQGDVLFKVLCEHGLESLWKAMEAF